MFDWTPWAAGPPPRTGWFNASAERTPGVMRYWNGKRWSAPCLDESHADRTLTPEAAKQQADRCPAACIEWRTPTEATRRYLIAEGCDEEPEAWGEPVTLTDGAWCLLAELGHAL